MWQVTKTLSLTKLFYGPSEPAHELGLDLGPWPAFGLLSPVWARILLRQVVRIPQVLHPSPLMTTSLRPPLARTLLGQFSKKLPTLDVTS